MPNYNHTRGDSALEPCPICKAEREEFLSTAAVENKLHDEQQTRENTPINARPLAAPVFVLEQHYEYEGSTLIGVYASVDDAKADANRGVYGDFQTIHECAGGRLMKPVAHRDKIHTDTGKIQYGLWL